MQHIKTTATIFFLNYNFFSTTFSEYISIKWSLTGVKWSWWGYSSPWPCSKTSSHTLHWQTHPGAYLYVCV